jgi:hypothetical protein
MLTISSLRRRLTVCAITLPLSAMAYPDKPIEWVVPYPAGGGSDVVARTLAEHMGKTLSQTVIVRGDPEHPRADGRLCQGGERKVGAGDPRG